MAALLLVGSLVGCSGNDETGEKEETIKEETTKIPLTQENFSEYLTIECEISDENIEETTLLGHTYLKPSATLTVNLIKRKDCSFEDASVTVELETWASGVVYKVEDWEEVSIMSQKKVERIIIPFDGTTSKTYKLTFETRPQLSGSVSFPQIRAYTKSASGYVIVK